MGVDGDCVAIRMGERSIDNGSGEYMSPAAYANIRNS